MALSRNLRRRAGVGGCMALLLVLLLPALAGGAPPGPTCRRCHPAHYQPQGTCTHCHRGDDRAMRQELAHSGLLAGPLASFRLPDSPARARGERLADQLACRRCHALAGRGAPLAGDLDQAAATRPIGRLREALQTPAWYMPDFRLAPAERDDLLTYLLARGAAAQAKQQRREVPLVVHFAKPGESGASDPFSRHCGGCHMTLTAQRGGLGRGKTGPNLAGLLGEHYPRSYRRQEPWTATTLRDWLKNPRASRPLATMPPVPLTAEEFAALVSVLQPPPH